MYLQTSCCVLLHCSCCDNECSKHLSPIFLQFLVGNSILSPIQATTVIVAKIISNMITFIMQTKEYSSSNDSTFIYLFLSPSKALLNYYHQIEISGYSEGCPAKSHTKKGHTKGCKWLIWRK
jgi:hypothetical protein